MSQPHELDELRAQVDAHPLWQSPLLVACEGGHLTRDDFQLVFSQYHLYSRSFTRFLAALIASCDDDTQRADLAKNMSDEMGDGDAARRHAMLFRGFLERGLGVDPSKIEYLACARAFVRRYLDFCRAAPPAASVRPLMKQR
jgi:pyrroloquinoline quinone (PQQ) biosynthesis protein C